MATSTAGKPRSAAALRSIFQKRVARRQAKLKAAVQELVTAMNRAAGDEKLQYEAVGFFLPTVLWLAEKNGLTWQDMRAVMYDLRGPTTGIESWFVGNDATAKMMRGER